MSAITNGRIERERTRGTRRACLGTYWGAIGGILPASQRPWPHLPPPASASLPSFPSPLQSSQPLTQFTLMGLSAGRGEAAAPGQSGESGRRDGKSQAPGHRAFRGVARSLGACAVCLCGPRLSAHSRANQLNCRPEFYTPGLPADSAESSCPHTWPSSLQLLPPRPCGGDQGEFLPQHQHPAGLP